MARNNTSELKKFCAFSSKFTHWGIWVDEIYRRKNNTDPNHAYMNYYDYANSVMTCLLNYYNEQSGRIDFSFDNNEQRIQFVKRLIEVAEKLHVEK